MPKVTGFDLKKYRTYADWLQNMQTKYDIMSFRQDLPGFGEPQEGRWDGFQRLNTETKSGGLIAVFRHGARESTRTVTINYLDSAKTYDVKSMDGNVIASLSGNELKTKGFEVQLNDLYSGELFEVVGK